MPFTLEKSDSFGQLESRPNQLENSKLFTSVSKAVIEEFQKIVKNTAILGTQYLNPYTNKIGEKIENTDSIIKFIFFN